ncbi:MAG TPA: response regulator [Longimicrobiales bacterium]
MAELPAKIFIADDDPLLLEGLSRALSGRGYTVRTAPDGPQLLSLMERESPDLVVLDIMMPGMSGLDVLRRVRDDGRWPTVPVMMVTALTDAVVTESARNDGASEVIYKPFRLRDLVARIEDRLRRAQAARAVGDPPPEDGRPLD